MFNSLKNFALQKSYSLIRAKGVSCPQCATKLQLPEKLPAEGLDSIFQCGSCDWSGSPLNWVSDQGDSPQIDLPKPQGSTIVESNNGETHSWLLPPNKRPNMLIIFALLWLAGVSFAASKILFSGQDQANDSLGFLAFLVPFALIGVVIGYFGLRQALMETIVIVTPSKVQRLRKLFGKIKTKEILRSAIQRVELHELYRQNERPVEEVRLYGENNQKLGFGSKLKKNEKHWLLSQVRSQLGFSSATKYSRKQPLSDQASAKVEALNIQQLEKIQTKSLSLTSIGEDGFRLEVKSLWPKWAILGGVLGIVSPLLIYTIGGADASCPSEWSLFVIVDLIFDIIPLLMAVSAVIAGLVALSVGLHYKGRVSSYEFSSEKITVKRSKQNQLGKTTTYLKSDFDRVISKTSGHVNNDARYSVSLHGQSKKLTLTSFVDRQTSTALEDWLHY